MDDIRNDFEAALTEKLDDLKAKLEEAIAEIGSDDSSSADTEVVPLALVQTQVANESLSATAYAAIAAPIAAVCALALHCVKKKRESESDDSYMGATQA